MHDPMTVAFDLGVVTIWHVDPEKDGSDDSCWNDRPTGWRGWRWHFWHWKIQIHPVQNLKRWLFSRCADCGRGFKWGASVHSANWHGTGPRWFRGERDVYHEECT